MERPERSEFDSVDPAPPSNEKNIELLRTSLCDEDERMFLRMRALFSLRNIGGQNSVEALAAAFQSDSALLNSDLNSDNSIDVTDIVNIVNIILNNLDKI